MLSDHTAHIRQISALHILTHPSTAPFHSFHCAFYLPHSTFRILSKALRHQCQSVRKQSMWHHCGAQKFHYFRLRHRRRKSKAPPPAEFLAARRLARRNCSKPAKNYGWLRGWGASYTIACPFYPTRGLETSSAKAAQNKWLVLHTLHDSIYYRKSNHSNTKLLT